MTEKQKSKSNPFIDVLHPDEEILRMSMHPPMSFWNHLIGFMLRALVTILFLACFFGIFLTIFGLGDFSGPEGVTGEVLLARFLHSFLQSLTVIALLSLPLLVIFYVSPQHNTRQLRDAYAVTNQRLLLYLQGRMTSYRLDEPGLRTHKRSIAFVQTFAQAHDVEEVVQLIEETQNQLLTQQKSRHEEMLADAYSAYKTENRLRQAKR